jgi:DNA-directed RNA polymerase subunit RPC12/RpoP
MYHCKDCGMEFERMVMLKKDTTIVCHSCRFPFKLKEDVPLFYVEDVKNGERKSHVFYYIKPLKCPNCEGIFGAHLSWCGAPPSPSVSQAIKSSKKWAPGDGSIVINIGFTTGGTGKHE